MDSTKVVKHMMDKHTDLYVILQFFQEHFLVLLIYDDFLAVIDEVIVFVSWKLLGLLFTLGQSVKVHQEQHV